MDVDVGRHENFGRLDDDDRETDGFVGRHFGRLHKILQPEIEDLLFGRRSRFRRSGTRLFRRVPESINQRDITFLKLNE